MGNTLSLIATILFGALGMAPFAPLPIRLLCAFSAAFALVYLVGSLAEQWRVRRKAKSSRWSFIDRHEGKVPWIARSAIIAVLLVARPTIMSWYVPTAPRLNVSDSLEIHEEPKAFRLVVTSDTEALIDVSIERLIGGLQQHDAELPLRLGVTRLTPNTPLRIPVVAVNQSLGVLIVGGVRHLMIYDSMRVIPAELCIKVAIIGRDVVAERRIRLVPDLNNRTMLYRSEPAGHSCS